MNVATIQQSPPHHLTWGSPLAGTGYSPPLPSGQSLTWITGALQEARTEMHRLTDTTYVSEVLQGSTITLIELPHYPPHGMKVTRGQRSANGEGI
ncbi:hypothetical protein E2C01_086686 [Portunus trituberculatus]|uniref:Uncharacterized protein n=1 Tax=Portunus trituberculatus TaxID=210409 RepID=A0A5B7JAE5_PORTR|nr:hypothetical protein [Portunus trituberculatus]